MEMEAGEGGGGGVWREEGLCLEETLRAPVPRLSGTLLVLVRCLPGPLISPFETFASAVLWQGARSEPRSREKTETTHNVSIVSFKRMVNTVIIVMCGFSLCPLNPEESHTENKFSPKSNNELLQMTIPSVHITPP